MVRKHLEELVDVSTNSEVLGRFYGEYRQQLFTCALVITFSPPQAEDAVHEAFCRLLGKTREPDDLKAYVFRAVRNAALDIVRRRKRSPEPLPDFVFDPNPTPDLVVSRADFQQQVVGLILNLRPDERETIVQHLYGELTFQEIAAVRQKPMGTVVSWYRRGLEKLQKEMEVPDGSV